MFCKEAAVVGKTRFFSRLNQAIETGRAMKKSGPKGIPDGS